MGEANQIFFLSIYIFVVIRCGGGEECGDAMLSAYNG